MADFDPERDPVDVLAEEFAERCRRGETPSVGEYAARYPEWADQLRELLPPVAQMERLKRLKQPGRAGDDGPPLERLGDYRIVREVGRGGMGIVYEAVQESLGRHVALKVLPGHSLLDPKKLERFRREAQAAAGLHHTNIVPVFDVGEENGLHYYVMQFIEGQGLDRVLAGWRCTPREEVPGFGVPGGGPRFWRQIARVGVEAAEALHYAHQQGTLHRDVKPANLLLDRHGNVWVTDFGLAKRIDHEGLTSTGDILGTLQYMAPECLEGRADARSDVYSLGLTLYEMLTLEPPFRGPGPANLLGAAGGQEPVSPRRVNRAIPRDLETIVLRATAREPGRRYPTAQALADDLRRFVEDRPIEARRSTPAERLRRWCRRNPAVAGLAAALVVVFLAGFAGVCWKWQEAAAEERRAEDNLRRAEANERLSLQVFEEIFNKYARRQGPPVGAGPPGPPPFDSEEDAALLQSVLKFYDQFAEQNAGNSKLRREAARAHRRVGDIRQRFGQRQKAEAAYRRAAAMLEQLARESPPTAEDRLEWAETYTMPEVRSTEAGELAEAETGLRRALAVAGESPEAPGWRRAVLAARGRLRLGSVLERLGREAEAEAEYREGVRLQQTLAAGNSPAAFFARMDLCGARQALADFLCRRGQPAEARALVGESIQEMERWPRFGPGGWVLQKMLAGQYRSLATALRGLGEPAPAAEASEKAKQLEENPPPPPFMGPRPG